MNTLAKLRELAAVRSILHDAIEERFGRRDVLAAGLPVTDRISVLSLEATTLAAELVGEIQWRPWPTLAKSVNIHKVIAGDEHRVRHRRVRQRLEAHYIRAIGENADIRSTSMMRVMFDQMATEQIELEDRLEAQMFQALASTHLVPYTDEGIEMIHNTLTGVLEAQGLTNVDVAVAAPTHDQLDVTYTAAASGTVETVTISGTVDF